MTRLARTPAILGILVGGMVAGGLPAGCSSNHAGIGLPKVDAQAPSLDTAAGHGGATGAGSDAAAAGNGGSATNTGGATGSGGITATGGSATTGGAAGEGGTTGAGGTTRAGGATGAGGAMGAGGATGAGGTTRAGGATGTGGNVRTGGATGVGGVTQTGGTPASGGTTGAGGATQTGGTGGTGTICGGLPGYPCSAGEFCETSPGQCCCDFFGTCAARPQVCSDLYSPVCGCDGKTYSKDCVRLAAGMSKNFDGPCPSNGTGGSTGAGGAAAGGRTGTGGTTTGGTGGTSTGGTGGSSSGYPECTTSNDCQLIGDCCNCLSMPKGSAAPSCDAVECFASNCELRKITASDVACIAGRCTFSRTCNPAGVTCMVPIAECLAGQTQLIVGTCYSGGCVPVEECSDVASCDVCNAAGLSCVTYQTRPPSYHCVSTPPQCVANPTCACMGICSGALSCIAPESATLTCQCPEC